MANGFIVQLRLGAHVVGGAPVGGQRLVGPGMIGGEIHRKPYRNHRKPWETIGNPELMIGW